LQHKDWAKAVRFINHEDLKASSWCCLALLGGRPNIGFCREHRTFLVDRKFFCLTWQPFQLSPSGDDHAVHCRLANGIE
jgi:hypothetical protein